MDLEPTPDQINVVTPGKRKLTKKDRVKRAAIGLAAAMVLTIIGAMFERVALILVISMPAAFGLIIYLGLQGYSIITNAENDADEKWRTARMETIAESQKKSDQPKETVTYH